MAEKKLMKGNEAFAAAAINAGCRYYFGYPITPQSEVPEYMSRELKKAGGAFIQAESELGAINMAYGAAAAGGRVLITSSSPGIALMQESIGLLCSVELPVVIINVMRGGPGIGSIQPGQADYNQVTRGGSNGDYHTIVLAPNSIQEAIDIMMTAFDKGEKYRVPVLFLADGIIAQMMEPVEMPEMVDYKIDPEKKPWAATGWKPGDDPAKRAVINSLFINTEDLTVHNDHLQAIYAEARKNEQMWEEYRLEDAEYIITAFGTVSRIARSAVDELREMGIKAGLFRPITVWPFPYEHLKAAADREGVKALLDVEANEGQMLEDVKLAVNGTKHVDFFGHCGSLMPTTEEIKAKILEMKEGK